MSEDITPDAVRLVKEKLDAIHSEVAAQISDEALITRMKGIMESELADDTEFVRKLRHAASEPKLQGSKYGRLGLTVGDIEFLHGVMTSTKRFGGPGPSEELDNAFKAVSAAEYQTVVAGEAADLRHVEDMFNRGQLDQPGFKRAVAAIRWNNRAMDTAESGYGSQLIGAQYVGDLWAGARAESRVFGQIPTFQMDAPTAYLPVAADLPELLFVAESTASNSANYTTSKSGSNRVQVDAKKFVIHQMWSGEMAEDSIIPFIPFIRGQALAAIAHYSDSLVLNGDTTNAGTGNINLDDADPADTKHYLAFDGIRHAFLVDNTGNAADAGGALTFKDLADAKGDMISTTYLNDWGHPNDLNDLIYVADPETVDAISQLDEVITLDKFGPGATVLTGQQARVLGSPLISSMAVSKTEADGKVSTTANNNTKGQVVVFNRRGFNAGIRRDLAVAFEPLPATDQYRLVHSLRLGFGRYSPTGAASGIEAAAGIYNITL